MHEKKAEIADAVSACMPGPLPPLKRLDLRAFGSFQLSEKQQRTRAISYGPETGSC
jgi:hypothetical protein